MSYKNEVRKRILIIDDDQNIRKAITRLLIMEENYEVQEADGYDAKEKMKVFLPDLLILDIKMPGKSGYEVFAELRTDASFENMKIIGISGVFGAAGASFMEALNADAYFEKPFDNQELVNKISDLLKVEE